MHQIVYLVYKCEDMLDSIWTAMELANTRMKELRNERCDPYFEKYLLNAPEGFQ